MIQVEFWGGPKDGEIAHVFQIPTLEFILMEGMDASMDMVKFYEEIKDHPLRTQKYHKYTLFKSEKKRNCYRYVYDGIV